MHLWRHQSKLHSLHLAGAETIQSASGYTWNNVPVAKPAADLTDFISSRQEPGIVSLRAKNDT